ncbi:hypothetical protein FRC01_008115 [Tulasnella sp. 417]|nr:hypothetical protein FRC01_008115 [Tulasnella sp. 417]
MNALASNELFEEAMALIADMDACGVAPDVGVYNHALKACSNNPKRFRELLARMEKENVRWDGVTYGHVIHHRLHDGELELALQDFNAMLEAGHSVPRHVAERMAFAAVNGDHPRLALDLIRVYEAGTSKALPPTAWIKTLSKSVELHYDEGVRTCLERVQKEGISIDEGLTTEILLYSGRVADLELAESMLEHLKKLEVKLQEQHLAPLLEIYVKRDDIDGAFAVVERMTDSGIQLTNSSTKCLAEGLTQKQDKAALRKVYDALETSKQSGKAVPIALINAALRGSIWCADKVDWWTDLYNDLGSYNTFPNRQTFNTLLQLCLVTKDEPLSQRIYDDLLARAAANGSPKSIFKPDAWTYRHLSLIAVQQQSYEAAFHWLEETKAAGFVPFVGFYTLLIRRCAWRNDDRWKPALEEMKAQGYNTGAVEKFLRSRGLLPGKGADAPSEGVQEKKDQSAPRMPRRAARDADV